HGTGPPAARTPPPLTPYRRQRPRHSDACSGRRLPEASRRLAEPRPPLTPAPTAIIPAAGLRRIPPSRHRLSTAIKASPPAPHPHTQTPLATTASPSQRERRRPASVAPPPPARVAPPLS